MPNIDLKAQLQQFMDTVWNAGDFSTIGDIVSERYTVKHDPGDAWDGQTLDYNAFKQRVQYSRNAFPDLDFAIQDMVAEANRVVAFWIMSGTHADDLDNFPATGKSFAISGITIYDFDDNAKVCGHTQAYDRLGFLAQVGGLQMLKES